MMYRHSNVWRNSNVMRCNMNRCISMHDRYFSVMNEWRFNIMMNNRHFMVDRHSNVRSSHMNWSIGMHDRYFRVMNEWRFNVMMDRGVVMNNWRFMVDRYSNLRWCRYIMVNHCFNHMSL